jgi:hypothetical protein
VSRYRNRHRTQYCSGCSSTTRSSGCTWVSASNGADAATRGRVDLEPDQVHAKVKRTEEVNPYTPGWHLDDVDLAMKRIGVGFDNRTGAGWPALRRAHDDGYYILLQGDSDRFGNSTCSGAFDGLHCVGIHPDEDSRGRWRIDDPICKTARYETESTLFSYAAKLSSKVFFGVFTNRVPLDVPDTSTGDDMLFNPEGTDVGELEFTTASHLWRVSDEGSIDVSKGTTRHVYSRVEYALRSRGETKPTRGGYLVTYNGEAHIAPSGVVKFTPESPTVDTDAIFNAGVAAAAKAAAGAKR